MCSAVGIYTKYVCMCIHTFVYLCIYVSIYVWINRDINRRASVAQNATLGLIQELFPVCGLRIIINIYFTKVN